MNFSLRKTPFQKRQEELERKRKVRGKEAGFFFWFSSLEKKKRLPLKLPFSPPSATPKPTPQPWPTLWACLAMATTTTAAARLATWGHVRLEESD